ncbi:MAG: hypothetical protein WBG37_07955 [Desulfobacterales bacterium]
MHSNKGLAVSNLMASKIVLVLLLTGLGTALFCSGENARAADKTPAVARVDPCTLVTHTEAERLIGETLQPGQLDTRMPHLSSCVWTGAKGSPKLILQHWPEVKGALESWLGAGDESKVLPLEGLSGEAIAAIQKGNPQYNIKPGLSLVAVRSKASVVSLSAPFLEAAEGSEPYNQMISLADTAARRLTEQ